MTIIFNVLFKEFFPHARNENNQKKNSQEAAVEKIASKFN